ALVGGVRVVRRSGCRRGGHFLERAPPPGRRVPLHRFRAPHGPAGRGIRRDRVRVRVHAPRPASRREVARRARPGLEAQRPPDRPDPLGGARRDPAGPLPGGARGPFSGGLCLRGRRRALQRRDDLSLPGLSREDLGTTPEAPGLLSLWSLSLPGPLGLEAAMKKAALAVLALLALGPVRTLGADDILRLPIGDPARRGKEVPLVLDGVTNTAVGEVVTPSALPAAVADVRILFVGEGHTEMESHRVELRILEELVRSGRRVAVGVEMYPYTEQKLLDQWNEGKLDEKAFVEASRWYKNWGYHWNYYRDIFLFAQKHRVPIFAINTPREVVAAVRRKGFEGLSDEEKAHIPPKIDVDNADHMRLFKASFEAESFHTPGISDQACNA